MKIISSIRNVSVFVLVLVLITGCKKDEGPGGTSTIKGKIIVYDFDAAFQSAMPLDTFPAMDQDIYIIYGTDGTTYDDDFKTSYDGSYEFKYLQKGQYRLYAYSKDSTGAKANDPSLKDVPVFMNIEITSNGSTVIVQDMIILDNNQ